MTDPEHPNFLRVFGRIGLLSFGGPAAQIALMHRELVETRDWLSDERFLRALSLCMLLPGPEAMQLATYAGWRLRGISGGLWAGLLFVLPGALVVAILALLYARFGQLPLVQASFLGIKAAVIVVVLQALRNLAKRALVGAEGWTLAALGFLALFVFGLPFPLVIVTVGLWGFLRSPRQVARSPAEPEVSGHPFVTLALWGAIWAAPLVVVWGMDDQFLFELGLFFSKLAVVTFGGAYAVLGYMTQTVVTDLQWITTAQMIDALGLAETTPGPLILVTEFVALLAGYAQSGLSGAIAAGLLALWVTFTPCFLWIFLAGPYLERLSAMPRLSGALRAITAAVVGIIANLSVWFALHVWFAQVIALPGLALPVPVWITFHPMAAMLTALGVALMIWRGWGFVPTMGALAATAFVIALF